MGIFLFSWWTIQPCSGFRALEGRDLYSIGLILSFSNWSERILVAQSKYVARLKSLPENCWRLEGIKLKPEEIDDVSCIYECRRNVGRPLCRWEDNVAKFCRVYVGNERYDVAKPRFLNGVSALLNTYNL